MAKLSTYSWVGEGVHAIASRPIRLRYTMSPPISGRTHAIFRAVFRAVLALRQKGY